MRQWVWDFRKCAKQHSFNRCLATKRCKYVRQNWFLASRTVLSASVQGGKGTPTIMGLVSTPKQKAKKTLEFRLEPHWSAHKTDGDDAAHHRSGSPNTKEIKKTNNNTIEYYRDKVMGQIIKHSEESSEEAERIGPVFGPLNTTHDHPKHIFSS